MSTVTPDLSDFSPDAHDMSDFKADSPVESPIAPPGLPKPSVQPESMAGFVNRITGHPDYTPQPFTPQTVAKGTLNDFKTLTVGGVQAMARGLAGGKPVLGMPPPPEQTIQAGANIGVGMLLGGMEGEGISPTEGLNRVINKVPATDPKFSMLRGASPEPGISPVDVGKLPIAKGNPYEGPRTPASMDVIKSTNHDLAGYHPESQTMTIQFKNGRVYSYRGVPQEIYDQYLQSESQGSFFANNIKGRYQTDFRGTVKPSAGAQVRKSLGR